MEDIQFMGLENVTLSKYNISSFLPENVNKNKIPNGKKLVCFD